MKNNHFLHISCLALIALLNAVSLNKSTVVKVNTHNDYSSTWLTGALKDFIDIYPDFEITPGVNSFTYDLANELTKNNLGENKHTQSNLELETNLDFVFYAD